MQHVGIMIENHAN